MPAEYEVEINGKRLKAIVEEVGASTYKVMIGGSEFTIRVSSLGAFRPPQITAQAPTAPTPASSSAATPTVQASAPLPSKSSEAGAVAPQPTPSEMGEGTPVKVEVPGRVLKVLVKEGQKVNAGDTILTIESMKMELEIKTPVAGTVSKVLVKPGDSVNTGDVVAVVKG
jgi:biotin carboxyl carrier protein